MSSDTDQRRHETLELLKPICITMMQDCSKNNIARFISALAKVNKDIAQEIQQYILFPLQNAMHQKKLQESSFCDVMSALDAVLDKTSVQKTQIFLDIFNPIVYYLSSPTNPSQVSVRSEETKTTAVKTLSNLLKSSSNGVLNDVYSLSCLPAIGQLVSLLLNLSEIERSRSLQIASMDCLMVVMQLESKYCSTREVHLGNYFVFCLPGVTMAMSRIITGDQKQGSEVIKKAMMVWSKAVCLVMSDHNIEQSKTRNSLRVTDKNPVGKDKLESLMIDRNEDWVKGTASKLNILIGQICKLGSHSNWRVRLSLTELSERVLSHCSQSLCECVPKLLESLVALINDDFEKVSSKAFTVLQAFSNGQVGLPGERTLLEMLEDNVHNLATSLPRQIRMCDEEEKLPLINLLKGYIMLFGPNISCVINSSCHLHRLALALVQILELDAVDGKILEERAKLLDYESDTFHQEDCQVWKPKKYFKHFRDESILSALISVCQLLGKYGNVYILVDCFLDLFHESSVYKLESILIINEIVLGAGKNDDKRTENLMESSQKSKLTVVRDVIRMLLDEYVCTVNIHDTTTTQQHQSRARSSSFLSTLTVTQPGAHRAALSVASHNKEILLSCLFMEGVGKFASVLGQGFGVYLIHTLYPLVENLGHENIHISSTAFDTLTHICAACHYRSLDSLIQDNADYLVNSVSLRLRHFNQNQRTTRLLCVMFRYCSEDLLPLVEHSIGEILDTLDDHYTEDLVLFMPVLLELTSAIGRWFPSTTQMSDSRRDNLEKSSSIVQCLEEYVRLKRTAEGDFEDGDCEGGRTLEDIEKDMIRIKKERVREKDTEEMVEEEEDAEEEKRKECPKHIQVVKEVLARIKNLLSSHDARVRVQSLDVLAQSCRDLASHERELLPQVHQVWTGFFPRFHSEEKFVVIKAVQTLKVMADVTGDFILLRVMKDVVPGLSQFMEKQASIRCDSRSTYVNTASFKLQVAILETIGPLSEKLELKERNLDVVAKICLPYLSRLQPEKLQKASMSSFKSFISLDPDTTWLLLCQAYCPCHYKVPGDEFTPLPKAFQAQTENNYTENVTELFKNFYCP